MTPDELRKLADEATPGPWTITNAGVDGGDGIGGIRIGEDDFIETDGGFYGPQLRNARLITLAPDLARLCAELGEALELLWVHYLLPMDIEKREHIVAALAKLSELETPQ